MHMTAAFRAAVQRFIAEFLYYLALLAAAEAFILVYRHC